VFGQYGGASGANASHARTDSAASEDSTNSIYFPSTSTPAPSVATPSSKLSKSFTASAPHAATTTTSTTPVATRKTSLASLRNAFSKSSKLQQDTPPPMPPLKNPFGNRSTTSLAATSSSQTATSTRRPSTSVAPFGRPSTPGSGGGSTDARFARGLTAKTRSRPANHSSSGSIFAVGSDDGLGFKSSPPPVPALPFTAANHRKDESFAAAEDPAMTLDPRTPSDYALHAVFMRFATAAEVKLDSFLRQPLASDPLLSEHIGPGLDPAFDDLLNALGQIARRHAKPVVDSVMRWRKAAAEGISADVLRLHTAPTRSVAGPPVRAPYHQSQPSLSRAATADVNAALSHRKSLASIYIMCRALLAVVHAVSIGGSSKGGEGLGDQTGLMLEEITFEPFRRPDVKLLAQSANYRTNTELFAKLLGALADLR
jgi:hypothetical protein